MSSDYISQKESDPAPVRHAGLALAQASRDKEPGVGLLQGDVEHEDDEKVERDRHHEEDDENPDVMVVYALSPASVAPSGNWKWDGAQLGRRRRRHGTRKWLEFEGRGLLNQHKASPSSSSNVSLVQSQLKRVRKYIHDFKSKEFLMRILYFGQHVELRVDPLSTLTRKRVASHSDTTAPHRSHISQHRSPHSLSNNSGSDREPYARHTSASPIPSSDARVCTWLWMHRPITPVHMSQGSYDSSLSYHGYGYEQGSHHIVVDKAVHADAPAGPDAQREHHDVPRALAELTRECICVIRLRI